MASLRHDPTASATLCSMSCATATSVWMARSSAPHGLETLDMRRRGGIVDVRDQDLRAFRSQPARCRPTDAQHASGDHGYLSFKSP